MSGAIGGPPSESDIIKMGKNLLKVGEDIKKLLSDNAECSKESKEEDLDFLEVFGEVVAHIGHLFKNTDAAKELQSLLAPLSSYTSLLPYFLLIKSILGSIKKHVQLDWKEHKERLEWVNNELARIAVQATAIARKLEDLGNSLIEIIRGEERERSANLKIFDIHYHKISFSLESCISDMVLVKRKIDEGFRSINAYKKITLTCVVFSGIFALAAAIIAPIAVGYLGLIAAYGIWDMIGVGTVAALTIGGITTIPSLIANKTADNVKECYNDQHFNWQNLDEKLQTMKKELQKLHEVRITVA